MAGFGDIPIPKQFSSMGELADLLLNKRKMQQEKYLQEMQNAQRAKEAAETAKYHQGMLGISQSAESRAQKLLPYTIQKSQADLRKSQQEQSILEGIMGGGQNSQPSLYESLKQPAPQSNPMSQPSAPPAPMMGGGSAESPEMGGGGPPDRMGAPPQSPQDQAPQAQGPQNQGQAPNLGSLKQGQVMVTVPPQDQNKAGWDRFAGMKIGGIQIPDARSRVEDGIEYKTYPSGMQVATKVGPSYEEKLAFSEQAKQERAMAQLNEKDKLKRRGDIRSASKNFMTLLEHAANIDEIFEKHPNITGLGTPLKVKAGFGSGPQGRLQANIMPLVGPLAKQMSDRGGAAVAGFAATGKPGLGNSPEYNKEMTSEIIKEGLRTFDMLKQEYEELGMKFPYELPKRLRETISVKDNETGKVVKMTRADFMRLEG